jgi:nitrogen fixation/metabolism regulation signal transduction histidine kinase
VLVALAAVDGLPWGVLIQQPSQDAFAPVNRMLEGASVLVGGAVLLAVVLGTGLAIWIGRPLVRMRGAAEAMADGDLGRRITFAREDEISDLGHAFNRMADQLQRTLFEHRQSEERYRSLVECSLEPVLVHAVGRVRYANPAALRMLGAASASHLVGSEISVFMGSVNLPERARQR